MGHRSRMDKEKEINNIYDEFRDIFNSEKFEVVKEALFNISVKNKGNKKFFHDLGKFVILYSLPSVNPEVVIVGNNPSWFHKSNAVLAKENLKDVAEKIPKVNSYKEHNHKFGNAMEKVFRHLEKEDWINTVVGLNRFWIQTGGKGTDELKKEIEKIKPTKPKFKLFKDLENICEEGTKKIVKILNPQLVILLGNYAQNTFSSSDKQNMPDINFCNAIHPAYNKEEETAEDINRFLRR